MVISPGHFLDIKKGLRISASDTHTEAFYGGRKEKDFTVFNQHHCRSMSYGCLFLYVCGFCVCLKSNLEVDVLTYCRWVDIWELRRKEMQ